jgi:hypothetical protein
MLPETPAPRPVNLDRPVSGHGQTGRADLRYPAGMLRSLGSPPAPRLLALLALLASPIPVACFGHVELEACTFTDPTGLRRHPCGVDLHERGAGSEAGATTGGGTTGASADTDGASGSVGATDTGGRDHRETGETGLPIDPPPDVWDLVCDPEIADEVGPVTCTYQVSPDAVEADLLDDGVVVATGPAGAPLVFPVTSAPHNNPGSELAIVVRDAAGQTAQTSIYQPGRGPGPRQQGLDDAGAERRAGQHGRRGRAARQERDHRGRPLDGRQPRRHAAPLRPGRRSGSAPTTGGARSTRTGRSAPNSRPRWSASPAWPSMPT